MEKITDFLSKSHGRGYGDGSGRGYGYGDGSGSGSGYGRGYDNGNGSGSGYGRGYDNGNGSGNGSGRGYDNGNGSGNGSGRGSGRGYGYGIKSINKENVHMIDGVPTVIRRVRGGIAKGAILRDDFTLSPCYVVKSGDFFAHGKSIKEAMEAVREKLFCDMDEDERIEAFVSEFTDINKEHKADVFFDWHGRLTGSCLMGREEFIKREAIRLEDKMTVKRFIKLTENEYGGDVIKKLKERYKIS